MNKKIIILLKLSLVVILSSCSKPAGPKQGFIKFINYRFEQNQTREELLRMTADSLNESIANMSEEAFAEFVRTGRKKKSLKILNIRCEEIACSVSYIIKYDDFREGEKSHTIESKKVAELKNVDGAWKISDVTNIKQFHKAHKAFKVREE